MTQILEIDTNTPWWKQDLDRAIAEFKSNYGVEPHIIIGKNIMEALTENVQFIHETVDSSKGKIGLYKGTPYEYDPDILSYVIMEDIR